MLNKGNGILKSYALCDGKQSMSSSLNLAMEAIINPTHPSVSDLHPGKS